MNNYDSPASRWFDRRRDGRTYKEDEMILYKGSGKGFKSIKSYRPLMLLPVLGNMYEKLIP
ncbi:hypothetical protein PR048_023665 [Dryococelus australis]|uniref:Uncharacterized protein n=1 Tax=Dryococelus australis TaxID=614101 RepID=A0ABQ9GUT1_9NEOP|nr:hypothetical protein PR048_023665 [Dryococelus australis]